MHVGCGAERIGHEVGGALKEVHLRGRVSACYAMLLLRIDKDYLVCYQR